MPRNNNLPGREKFQAIGAACGIAALIIFIGIALGIYDLVDQLNARSKPGAKSGAELSFRPFAGMFGWVGDVGHWLWSPYGLILALLAVIVFLLIRGRRNRNRFR